MDYKLTDREVMWVLLCLKDLRHHPLNEIVAEYNRQHPPSVFLPVPKGQNYIRSILKFLEREKLVIAEVFTFFEEPIPATKFYVLTQAGIQRLNARR